MRKGHWPIINKIVLSKVVIKKGGNREMELAVFSQFLHIRKILAENIFDAEKRGDIRMLAKVSLLK